MTFVGHDQLDVIDHDLSHVLIWLSEPAVVDGQVTVTSGLRCGELCGSGGAYALEINDDAAWSVTGTLGIQWES